MVDAIDERKVTIPQEVSTAEDVSSEEKVTSNGEDLEVGLALNGETETSSIKSNVLKAISIGALLAEPVTAPIAGAATTGLFLSNKNTSDTLKKASIGATIGSILIPFGVGTILGGITGAMFAKK